jgi:type IV secretory pathway TraG/TraD family ATPase VirD4
MKYAFQQAATRRFEDIRINGQRLNPPCPDKKKARPCFLVADEHQDVFDMRDSDFQTINRSYKVAPIYLTQNLPNYYKKCPNRDAVDTLDANLQTQVCHHNGCPVTNEHMSKKIGKAMRVTSMSRSDNSSSQGQSGGSSMSSTRTEESIVKPSDFSKLRKGGPAKAGEPEGWFTEAILWKSGEQFGNNPYLKMRIAQTLV